MRTLVGILLIAACLVACTHSYPGSRSDESDETNLDTVLVLPSNKKDRFVRPETFDFSDVSLDDSIEDVSSSWSWPNTWYPSIEPILRRLRDFRRKMSDILPRLPEQGIISLGDIPEGANTTTTTKIIDGHVVTINETVYVNKDNGFETVVRVRVIDVKPENETILMTESQADADVTTLPTVTTTTRTSKGAVTSEEESTTASRSVETVEDFDNEIPKTQVDTLTA